MNGDPKTVDGTCGENLSMESEQETQIRNLKYRVEDLESDLRDLKEKLKEEVWYRKAQDQRLEGEIDYLYRKFCLLKENGY